MAYFGRWGRTARNQTKSNGMKCHFYERTASRSTWYPIVRLYFSQFFLSIPIFFIQTRGNDLFVEGKVADTAEKPPVHLHAKYPEKLWNFKFRLKSLGRKKDSICHSLSFSLSLPITLSSTLLCTFFHGNGDGNRFKKKVNFNWKKDFFLPSLWSLCLCVCFGK